MTLGEYLVRVTHREHRLWVEWLSEQWNEPERSDWYLMQIAAEIRQFRYGFSKHPQAVKLKDMKLPFKTKMEVAAAEQNKELSEREMQRIETAWMARLGLIGPAAREAREKREPTPRRKTGMGTANPNANLMVPKDRNGRPLVVPRQDGKTKPPKPTPPRRKG